MYFGKKFLKILYGKLSSLYTGNDINDQGGTQFVSELRYFFATESFVNKAGKPCNTREKDDKEKFIKYVGEFVFLHDTEHNTLYTKNFSKSFGNSKDYDVGSNFFSVNVVKNSLNSSDVFKFPSRHPVLLDVQNGTVNINKNAYANISSDSYYLGNDNSKFAILFVWLNRYTAFQSIQTAYDDFLKKLKNIYSNELIKALKWETDDVKKEVINLISDADVSEEQVFIEKSDFEQSNVKYDIVYIPHPHNRIIFGAPGTGKSHELNKQMKEWFDRNSFDSFNFIKEEIKQKKDNDYSMDLAAISVGVKYRYLLAYLLENKSKDILSEEIGIKDLLGGHARTHFYLPAEVLKIEGYKGHSNGKSYERVTFHPNYSYAQFVGTYKPVSRNNNGKNEITYEYVPGPFIKTWIRAYKSSQPQLLLIEEINRANVAAVFGDVFQLLDRDENGNSEYPITISEDLKRYLSEKEKIDVETISIPANMYIWATMNSADQGVLPMDAAFKRRWDFEYIGIDDNEDKVAHIKIPVSLDGKKSVLWNDFRKKLNAKLSDELKVNEDKLLGPFFLSKKSLENAMSEPKKFVKLFESKVIMYLFEDVVKMQPAKLFKCDKLRYSEICKEFEEKGMGVFGIDVHVFDM